MEIKHIFFKRELHNQVHVLFFNILKVSMLIFNKLIKLEATKRRINAFSPSHLFFRPHKQPVCCPYYHFLKTVLFSLSLL